MSPAKQLQSQWIDIQALPVPHDGIHWTSIVMAILAAFLLLVLVRYVYQRARFKAWRQLRNIQRQAHDSRQQLFLLSRILQQGLHARQLQTIMVVPQKQRQWQQFCSELVRYCYQASPPTREDVLRLTAQARDWLRRA